MKFLLNVNQFSERGTETATYELGRALKQVGHDVMISFPRGGENIPAVEQHFREQFDVIEFERIAGDKAWLRRNFDSGYLMKVDGKDGRRFRGIWNGVHAVFREYLPQGESYVYISKWLADEMKSTIDRDKVRKSRGVLARLRGCKNALKFLGVPYIVNMPRPNQASIRRDLAVPKDCFMITRYGGWNEFNIPWVRNELLRFLDRNSDVFFVAVNTKPFADHPRIIYSDRIINLQRKGALLESADLFLHARDIGETFGMSIVESMQMGTDVLSCSVGADGHHRVLLSEGDHLFGSSEELSHHLENRLTYWRDYGKQPRDTLMRIADNFRPENLIDDYLTIILGRQN